MTAPAKLSPAVAVRPGLRQALVWPHVWAGVTLGGLLLVIFYMGSLTVFAQEIDRWMMPATRLAAVPPAGPLSLDRQVRPLIDRLAAGRPQRDWLVQLPDSRRPVVALRLRLLGGGSAGGYATAAGQALPPVGTLGASSFFYPLHYSLLLRAGFIGYWIVAFAAMAMTVALVSGVIIHARLFKDFFTFRPWARPRRALLDLHNLAGVLALPFHLMITLTGVVIILPIVLPAGVQQLYDGDVERFYREATGGFDRPRSGVAAPLAPLDPMMAVARQRWGGADAAAVFVIHPGDAAAYVRINRATDDRISLDVEPIYFDGVTGALLQQVPAGPVVGVQRFMAGLHTAAFDRPLLRWLYFLLGLTGCVLIGTGLFHWLEARRPAPGQPVPAGWRGVAALTAAASTGLPAATLAMLAANRLLPAYLTQRELWEVAAFLLVWLALAVDAALSRGGRLPWRRHCAVIALLAAGDVGLNGITTGAFPWTSLSQGDDAVFGVDAVLGITALLAGAVAWRRAGPVERPAHG